MTDTALAIVRAVHDAGGRALIVGGWVRDRLMNRPSKDIDLEVYGLPADRLRRVLATVGPVNAVGESFTVYKVGDVDVALPRRESRIGRGHKGFEVQGDPMLSPAEAARRRDFTVNAISWDPLTGGYEDPFDGRGDISRGVLRAVDLTTFPEDTLRVLRAVQFVARFGFDLDPDTAELCRRLPLDDLPAERIWGEVEKLLLQSQQPSVGFDLALRLGVIDKLFPELKALVGCPQEFEWHPEGDVWVHTLLVVDQARTRIDDLDHPRQVAVMLGAVCHDLGKPLTTAFLDGRIRSIDHEQEGVVPATRVLDRLNIHTIGGFDVRKQVLGITAHHLKPGMFAMSKTPVSDGAYRRLAQKVDLELLARAAKSDCMGRGEGFDCSAMDRFLERARLLGVQHAPPAPLVLGRHLLGLGVTPGPRMGEILRAIYERQLDGSITTLEEGLEFAREYRSELMPRSFCYGLVLASVLLLTTPAHAQDPVPQPILDEPIAPVVVDARGVLARFKANSEVATVLGVEPADLPTRGLGLVVGAHVYPVRKRNFALGLGGELLLRARATRTLPPTVVDGPDGPTVVTRMTALSPQVSLNFGRRDGWSYLSGGMGWTSFTSELDDSPFADPESRPRSLNYGAGARWFAKKHVALSLDLRFYSIPVQEATLARPAFPRMTVMVFSAGMALR